MKLYTTSKGNEVKIFTDNVDEITLTQIKKLSEYHAYQNSKIRVMPDCHAGMGCTIGTTMTISDKVTPNLVGVDIGCGMLTVKIGKVDVDLAELDRVINEFVPHGFNTHNKPLFDFDLSGLRATNMPIEKAMKSIGTLGGGNHFIELSKDSGDSLYLIIHSGSRGIGNQVARYYQKLAFDTMIDNSGDVNRLIDRLKRQNRQTEISEEIKKLKKNHVDKDLAYLEGDNLNDYLNDMRIMQNYASINRYSISEIILSELGINYLSEFETIHNYIDFDSMILRKGAVSAKEGERLLIPINMRDGSILAKGKGNADWNYSAPHGAGRLMSRKKAHQELSLNTFKSQMKDVYSSSVTEKTLDEAPDAYKPIEDIVSNINDTVEIIDILKPIYNFKSH